MFLCSQSLLNLAYKSQWREEVFERGFRFRVADNERGPGAGPQEQGCRSKPFSFSQMRWIDKYVGSPSDGYVGTECDNKKSETAMAHFTTDIWKEHFWNNSARRIFKLQMTQEHEYHLHYEGLVIQKSVWQSDQNSLFYCKCLRYKKQARKLQDAQAEKLTSLQANILTSW